MRLSEGRSQALSCISVSGVCRARWARPGPDRYGSTISHLRLSPRSPVQDPPWRAPRDRSAHPPTAAGAAKQLMHTACMQYSSCRIQYLRHEACTRGVAHRPAGWAPVGVRGRCPGCARVSAAGFNVAYACRVYPGGLHSCRAARHGRPSREARDRLPRTAPSAPRHDMSSVSFLLPLNRFKA